MLCTGDNMTNIWSAMVPHENIYVWGGGGGRSEGRKIMYAGLPHPSIIFSNKRDASGVKRLFDV